MCSHNNIWHKNIFPIHIADEKGYTKVWAVHLSTACTESTSESFWNIKHPTTFIDNANIAKSHHVCCKIVELCTDHGISKWFDIWLICYGRTKVWKDGYIIWLQCPLCQLMHNCWGLLCWALLRNLAHVSFPSDAGSRNHTIRLSRNSLMDFCYRTWHSSGRYCDYSSGVLFKINLVTATHLRSANCR